ncbi:MAG TPA: PaaI family thioesterase [Solirubrobacteraceae bacterium]|nr:PaaI family thioesterase [Solirubrobacteraceae bacterium]
MSRMDELLAALPPAPFVDDLGLRFTELGEGWAESALTTTPRLTQAQGLVHAGVLATIADHTAGAAAATLVDEGRYVVTTEFKINLLRPVIAPRVHCRAEVVKPGRRITVVESRVSAESDDGERALAAIALLTLAVVGDHAV